MRDLQMGSIKIDESRCKGCGLCTIACPKKLIALSEKVNSQGFRPAETASQDACIGCAVCAEICPDVAIEVFK
jgi:2-oxoglutarate ferredoxin oxidoreductase subunit delta